MECSAVEQISEKRKHDRYLMVRNIKLYDPQSLRYRAGQTLNVSVGGALLAVRHGDQLKEGQGVEVYVEWEGAEGIVARSELLAAEVIRNEGTGGSACVVAVKFEEPHPVAQAA